MNTLKHMAGPDRLRALAITLVFIFHYRLFAHPAWVDQVGSFGWTGVDLFFVLSGYLIAGQVFRSLQQQSFSFPEFYIKRSFRILPAYWLVLGLYFLVPGFREWGELPPLWKFLSFTQNFKLDLSQHRTFSHAWSLCIEEQFYLLMPLVAWGLYRWRKPVVAIGLLLLLVLSGLLIRSFSWDHFVAPLADTDGYVVTWYQWIYYPTYNRLDGLLAGISIAGIFQYYPAVAAGLMKRAGLLLITGLGLLTAAFFLCADQFTYAASVFGYPLIALGYGCLLIAAISPGKLLSRPVSRVTTAIATWSYALYLSHKAVIHLVQDQVTQWHLAPDSTVMFLCCTLACILAAALLHFSVERPFLYLRDRVLQGLGKNR